MTVLCMKHRPLQQVALSLPVLLLKEKKVFIAYTPALDLSASGSTAQKAKKNFDTVVRLFLEELAEAGTTEQVFRDMGWSKFERQWQPPVEVRTISQMPFVVPITA